MHDPMMNRRSDDGLPGCAFALVTIAVGLMILYIAYFA